MVKLKKALLVAAGLSLLSCLSLFAAGLKPSLTCVGLYSETSDGYVSYRNAGKTDWTVVKVGDVIPLTSEIKINVDRDWVEFIHTGDPTVVYELDGPSAGAVVKKGSEILKLAPRTVIFPGGSASAPDPKFKDKLVVGQYLGRQVFLTADGDTKDIKYGDVLDRSGKVRIIAINNTLTLLNASGGSTTVIGPLNFTIDQVLSNKNLYKFLNVQK